MNPLLLDTLAMCPMCPGWAPVSTSGFDASYFLTPCPLSEHLAAPASCLPPGFVQQ